MEINLNSDLGEKSNYYDGKNDNSLLKIIKSANIACGFHAGNINIIKKTIDLAKKNDVNIGAHPGFNDKKNFGRKRIYLNEKELKLLIIKQLEIINEISNDKNCQMTHVKPHGALNNIACENLDVSLIIAKTIKEFNKDLIYVILPLNEMERAAKKINLKYACEIYSDRNYDDNGQLISRMQSNSCVNDPIIAANNSLEMIETSSIKCLSGKKIKCNIDTLCIHGDNLNSINIAKRIKKVLTKNNIKLLKLNELKVFL